MELETIKKLVDNWQEVADEFEGYKSTTDSGDGPLLIILANRTQEGNLRLTAWSVKDLMAVIPQSALFQAGKEDKGMPYSEVTISGL